MTLRELLTSDMDLATLLGLVRQGWAWWVEELAGMLPTSWRDRFSARPRVWIEPRGDGGWRFFRDGSVVERVGRSTRVGLLAPTEMVLTRILSMPRMPERAVRRAVGLNLDRYSPLAPTLIFADARVVERGDGGELQPVLLGLIGREDAVRLLSQARAEGFSPAALATQAADSAAPPRFDFLPQVLEAEGRGGGAVTRRYLWIAAVLLILVNLGVLVGRDVLQVARLRDAVEAQRPGVEVAERLRRRVRQEDQARREMILRGQRSDPLRVIDAITGTLAPPGWVQRLEWNGEKLRIAGYRRDDVDVAGALTATGMFAKPQSLVTTETPGAGPVKPFDVIAAGRGNVAR